MRFTFIGDYTVTECKDGGALITRDKDGDEVVLSMLPTFDAAVVRAWDWAYRGDA